MVVEAAAHLAQRHRHDLRRSAASGMVRIGVPASVVLGHVLKGTRTLTVWSRRRPRCGHGATTVKRLVGGDEEKRGEVVPFARA